MHVCGDQRTTLGAGSRLPPWCEEGALVLLLCARLAVLEQPMSMAPSSLTALRTQMLTTAPGLVCALRTRSQDPILAQLACFPTDPSH